MIRPLQPSTPLVGRGREQATLRESLAAALAGRGSLVLVGGEAGIGKTALAEVATAEAAGRDARVLVGRCFDLTETPPYGPWLELLARAPAGADLPALPAAVLPPERAGDVLTSQEAIFRRVRAYLAALGARQPLALLLDDLHWADPASLDLLRFLARQIADLPLLLLATYRADELTRHHPLHQLLPALVREARATRLDLRPLDEAGLRALVAARYPLPPVDAARLVGHLRERAEGNPFFAGEHLRALEEGGALRPAGDDTSVAGGRWALGDLAAAGVPPLLRQVIDARVARLGEAARGLLAVAAVVGQEVPLGLWATVAGAGEEALLALLERAAEARVLVPTPEGARFAHALLREVLYEGMLPVRRRALHRRAAEALLALPQPDPDAVAYHLQQAGDARAAAWLVCAGDRAALAYAYRTAAERYEVALRLLEERDSRPEERGWLYYRLNRVHGRASPQRGLAYLDEVARLGAVTGDRLLAAAALADRGLTHCSLEQFEAGLTELHAAITAFEDLDGADRARLTTFFADGVNAYYGGLVAWLADAGRYIEAASVAKRVLAERLDPWPAPALFVSSAVGQAYTGLAHAHAAFGRPEDALQAFACARAAHQAIGHQLNVGVGVLTELSFVVLPYQVEDIERRRLAMEGERAWGQSSGVLAALRPRLARVPLLLLGERWAEARELAAEVRGVVLVGALCTRMALGPLARQQGEPSLAWSVVREALPGGPTAAPGSASFLPTLAAQRLAAALALDAGDLPTARTWLEAHDRWLAWNGAVLGRSEGQLLWARYHNAAGDMTRAHEHGTRALAEASAPRQPLALLAAHRTLGELATAAGRHQQAAGHLAEALALAEACAAPYERALTLLARADLAATTGEGDRARLALDEARALLAPLEARPALARADALAARLGPAAPAPGPPPRPATHPAGLTAREAEVLRLVAEGLTNPRIAARLFLSTRTVEQHLRAIYGKLGVENRTAAARAAVERGLA